MPATMRLFLSATKAGEADQEHLYETSDADAILDRVRNLVFEQWQVELERVETRRYLLFSGNLEDVRAGHASLPTFADLPNKPELRRVLRESRDQLTES